MNPDDLTLRRAARHDKDAFEQIVLLCQDRIYALCRRMMGNDQDALDAAQESFVKMYLNIGQFARKSNFSTWAYRIAVNTCLDLLRKKQSRPSQSLDQLKDAGLSPEKPTHSAESQVLRELDNQRLAQAIDSLEENQRAVIVLRDIQGLSYGEISSVLNINLNTCKSRISRARQNLRKKLTGREELFSFPDV